MNSAENQINELEDRVEEYFLEYSAEEHGRCSTNTFFSSLLCLVNVYCSSKINSGPISSAKPLSATPLFLH